MLIISSPLECFSVELSLFNFFNISLLMSIISIMWISVFNNKSVVPNSYGLLSLGMYRTVWNLVSGYGFSSALFPLVYVVFYVILFCNLIGLVPYSFTPTAQLVFTLCLGISLLFGVLAMGVIRHSVLVFGYFCPAGTPVILMPLMICIEILSFISRTLSLGLRLAVNMITGHTLVKVFGSFIVTSPSVLLTCVILMILMVFLALEVLIAYLQAYIFTFLMCITLKELS